MSMEEKMTIEKSATQLYKRIADEKIEASKYSFDSMVGNASNIALIRRSISRNVFKQFTIYTGILGTGKSSSAKITALALTCENPQNGQPCCTCPACNVNKKALETGSKSPWVHVINSGTIEDKEEFNAILHDIFELQGGSNAKVYIFEEAHALKDIPGAETALLTEFDQIPQGVYIIFCTNKLNEIADELQSRAEIFTFSRLSDIEAELLVDRTLNLHNLSLSTDITRTIMKSSKGIPRDIINAINFTLDVQPTLEELRNHLQIISDSQLLQLFESMRSEKIELFATVVDQLLDTSDASSVLSALKSFIIQVVFLIDGGITGTFLSSDVRTIKEIFTTDSLNKIVNLLERSSYKINTDDLKLLLIHIRMIVQKRSASNILAESKRVAMSEKIATNTVNEEIKSIQNDVSQCSLTPLTISNIHAFGS